MHHNDRTWLHMPHRPLLMAVAVAAVFTGTVQAEEAKDGIEEVIVTAQKRAERLQDVPIAISAITSAQLESRGVDDVLDLGALAPNLQVSTYPTSNLTSQVAIRGGGTFNAAMYWEPSVGMYLDGVYLGKAVGSVFDMVDLERIEVLRGPQGTLYGRNTMSGAVNFVTRKPSGEFSGTAGIDIGNYGRHVEKLMLDLPKYGIASVSLGVRSEKRDGWVKTTPGSSVSDLNNRDKLGARMAVLLDFSKDLQVDYRYDYTKVDQNGQYNQLYKQGVFANLARYASQDRQKTAGVEYPFWERMHLKGHALTTTWALDNRNTLKWIASHRSLDNNDSFDLEGTPLSNFNGKRIADYTQIANELQWVGNTDRMKYVVGLYNYRDYGYTKNPHDNFLGGPRESHDSNEYGYGGKARSLYAQLDYNLTEQWMLSAGLRRTVEDKWGSRYRKAWNASGALIPNNPATPDKSEQIPFVTTAAKFSATTPMVSATYKFNEHLNVYAKYSEGFKSGGFPGEAPNLLEATTPFKPEKQKTYEIGSKMSSADNKLQLNAALFWNDVKDLQLSNFLGQPGLSIIRNAGMAELKGLELELAWRPISQLRLQAGYGYLQSKYKEYKELDNSNLSIPIANRPLIEVADNRAVPHAPKHTFNLTADASLGNTSYGRLKGVADYSYTASFYSYPYQLVRTNPQVPMAENSKVKGYGLLNLRLMLAGVPVGGPGDADVSLWVKNALDYKKPTNFIDFGPQAGGVVLAYFNEPRTYGMSFNYRW